MTLVFGDAGAIPYTFGGRFIDSNGLTEPDIARIFKIGDRDQKYRRYMEILDRNHPDLVVIGYGKAPGGIYRMMKNPHSPFGQHPDIRVPRALAQRGFYYVCSLPMYYDLHLAVRFDSKYRDDIAKALRMYSTANNGYVFENGFDVTDGKQTVHFPLMQNVSGKTQGRHLYGIRW